MTPDTVPSMPVARPEDAARIQNAWERVRELLGELREVENAVQSTSVKCAVHRAAEQVRLAFAEMHLAYKFERQGKP